MQAAGKPFDRPNLVFGGDVHVVWEKFCRYFDVEPRIVPLEPNKYTIGAEDVAPHVDENTIGVAAVLGTTFTGHADDVVGINDYLLDLKNEKGLDVPLHVDAASGGFVWPFLYPHSEWDFRLEQVRSINVSGHKFGLVYPGIGWLVFKEKSDLPEDLVFYENYLGKRDATFTLNFSTGSAMVLAQYYNFVRLGHDGYRYIMETMKYNARALAKEIEAIGEFELIGGEDEEQLPLVAFKLAGEHGYDEFDVSAQLAAERGWMVPAYTLPPNAEHIKIMRVLVKETLGHSLTMTLGQRHRRSVQDARGEGRTARARPQARQDEHRVLRRRPAAAPAGSLRADSRASGTGVRIGDPGTGGYRFPPSGAGRRPAAAEVRDDQRDDRHEVDLPEQRLGHRQRVAEVGARGEVSVADRGEGGEAEVQAVRHGRRLASGEERVAAELVDRAVDEGEEHPEQEVHAEHAEDRLKRDRLTCAQAAHDAEHDRRRREAHEQERSPAGWRRRRSCR